MDNTVFKDKPLNKRKEIFKSLMKDQNDRIAVIINKGSNVKNNLTKKKFLLPVNMKMSIFAQEIKNRLHLDKTEALFILFDGKTFNPDMTMNEIYHICKDPEDDFLYGTYNIQPTFG